MTRPWTATTEDSVSRAVSATSVIPDSSYFSAILDRMTAVRRSIASTTTAGEGGRGTLDARFENERPGVRINAVLARVAAGSTSESSLEES